VPKFDHMDRHVLAKRLPIQCTLLVVGLFID